MGVRCRMEKFMQGRNDEQSAENGKGRAHLDPSDISAIRLFHDGLRRCRRGSIDILVFTVWQNLFFFAQSHMHASEDKTGWPSGQGSSSQDRQCWNDVWSYARSPSYLVRLTAFADQFGRKFSREVGKMILIESAHESGE